MSSKPLKNVDCVDTIRLVPPMCEATQECADAHESPSADNSADAAQTDSVDNSTTASQSSSADDMPQTPVQENLPDFEPVNPSATAIPPTSKKFAFVRSYAFDKKQLLNTLYFTLASFGIVELAQALNVVALYGLAALFGLFAIVASAKIKHSEKPGKTEVRLSKSTRWAIRAMALLVPIPCLFMAGDRYVSDLLINKSDALYEDSKYAEQLQYLNYAGMIDPFRQALIDGRKAGSYWAVSNGYDALVWANKAVAMDPDNGYAWSIKAAALLDHLKYDKDDFHHLTMLKPTNDQDYIDAGHAVNEAIRLYPENGENYRVAAILNANENIIPDAISSAEKHLNIHNTESGAQSLLAEIYLKEGQFDTALSYADEAVTMAQTEGGDYSWSLKLRAEILNAMGRTEDAAADLALADSVAKANP